MGKTFVFNDPDKLLDMLFMRSLGYSTVRLGTVYKVDQSAISHQCKKYQVYSHKPLPKIRVAIGRRYDIVRVDGNRYDTILYEPINPGKRSYSEYLRMEKERMNRNKNIANTI